MRESRPVYMHHKGQENGVMKQIKLPFEIFWKQAAWGGNLQMGRAGWGYFLRKEKVKENLLLNVDSET